MSNRRRCRPAGTLRDRPGCGSCGRRIGAAEDRIVLGDGRLVCMRCRDRGVLTARLPCGHIGLPGMPVAADSADLSNFRCPRCSPHIPALPGYARSQDQPHPRPDRSRVPSDQRSP